MGSTNDQKHTIGVLVENQPGVLSRVAGLFSGRGFNIESLTVAETNEPGQSRITLVTSGDQHILEQITKQLNKLIDVIKVIDFRETEFVNRRWLSSGSVRNPKRAPRSFASPTYFAARWWT
jgi:acetolactate synthase-1/3 small subunit